VALPKGLHSVEPQQDHDLSTAILVPYNHHREILRDVTATRDGNSMFHDGSRHTVVVLASQDARQVLIETNAHLTCSICRIAVCPQRHKGCTDYMGNRFDGGLPSVR
jgi:hypothetical protein